jgi:hypothetical protein
MIILGGLLFAGGVSAAAVVTPAPKAATTPKLSLTPEQSKLVCLKGNLVLAVLNRGGYESQAYSFCSSYIKIPPVTSSVTTTQTSFVVTTTTEYVCQALFDHEMFADQHLLDLQHQLRLSHSARSQ